MIKNVFDQTPNIVEGITIERFLTLSVQITYLWNATHLLTVRREPEQGAFKIMNNLDDIILFFSQDPFKLQKQRGRGSSPAEHIRLLLLAVHLLQEERPLHDRLQYHQRDQV